MEEQKPLKPNFGRRVFYVGKEWRGQTLRQFRVDFLDMSQSDIGVLFSVGKSQVHHYETNKTPIPPSGVEVLEALARERAISLQYEPSAPPAKSTRAIMEPLAMAVSPHKSSSPRPYINANQLMSRSPDIKRVLDTFVRDRKHNGITYMYLATHGEILVWDSEIEQIDGYLEKQTKKYFNNTLLFDFFRDNFALTLLLTTQSTRVMIMPLDAEANLLLVARTQPKSNYYFGIVEKEMDEAGALIARIASSEE